MPVQHTYRNHDDQDEESDVDVDGVRNGEQMMITMTAMTTMMIIMLMTTMMMMMMMMMILIMMIVIHNNKVSQEVDYNDGTFG